MAENTAADTVAMASASTPQTWTSAAYADPMSSSGWCCGSLAAARTEAVRRARGQACGVAAPERGVGDIGVAAEVDERLLERTVRVGEREEAVEKAVGGATRASGRSSSSASASRCARPAARAGVMGSAAAAQACAARMVA
nr:hypothetical protein fge_13_PS127F06_c1_53943 [Paspalum simplex]